MYTLHCPLWPFPTKILNPIIPPNFSSQLLPLIFHQIFSMNVQLNYLQKNFSNLSTHFSTIFLTQLFHHILHKIYAPDCLKKKKKNSIQLVIQFFQTIVNSIVP